MRTYQLVLVLKSTLSESEKKKTTDSVKSWLKEAKIAKEETWGEKPLSYKIKKQDSGFFLNLSLETENVIPLDLEKRILANEDILRHLLIRTKVKVKKEKAEKKPKKTVKKKK